MVTIIALLVASGIYLTRGQLEFGQEVRIRGDIQAISTQLKLYEAMNGNLPTTEQGLEALVRPPQTEPKPRAWRQLLDQVPVDPWQNKYIYVYPGKNNPRGYDLYSAGADRKPGTDDDIGNWQKS